MNGPDNMVEVEALERRAADAEHRLYSFRQHRAARDRQLAEFIKDRAPDLWRDYAAVSVNGAAHFNDVPNYDRELNILQHRAEVAEERATKAEAALAAQSDLAAQRDELREALTWYEEKARNVRLGDVVEGNEARAALDADGGERARRALNTQGDTK